MRVYEVDGAASRLQKVFAVLGAVIVAVAMLALTGPSPRAQAAELPESIIDGGFIISDAEFFAASAMTEAQILSFLNERVPKCSASTLR